MLDPSKASGSLASNDDEGEATETATTIDINRRQQFGDAGGGFQETATHAKQLGSFSIPSTAAELHHAKNKWSEGSWQIKALRLINSDALQRLLIGLLVLDVLIIFSELGIDAYFPSCKFVIRDAISCCPAHDGSYGAHAENAMHRILGGGGGDSHSLICTNALIETNYEAGCDDHKYPDVHVAHGVLFWITIAILGTFLFELIFLTYLLGLRKFFHQLIYAVDLIIVSLSLVLELFFRFAHSDTLEELPGILVLFRVWRFVRIGHGLVTSTYEVQEHKMEVATEHIEALEERLKKYEDVVPKRPLEVEAK